MKLSFARSATLLVALAIAAVRLAAETAAVDTGRATLPPFELRLGSEELSRDFEIDIPNRTDAGLRILGVQCTPNVFVRSFPDSIEARKAARFRFVFRYARSDAYPSGDTVRLLTSAGIIELPIVHARDPLAELSPAVLRWNKSADSSTRTATLKVSKRGVQLVSAEPASASVEVKWTDMGNGIYQIAVTPTAPQHGNVPVVLRFSQDVLSAPVLVAHFAGGNEP